MIFKDSPQSRIFFVIICSFYLFSSFIKRIVQKDEYDRGGQADRIICNRKFYLIIQHQISGDLDEAISDFFCRYGNKYVLNVDLAQFLPINFCMMNRIVWSVYEFSFKETLSILDRETIKCESLVRIHFLDHEHAQFCQFQNRKHFRKQKHFARKYQQNHDLKAFPMFQSDGYPFRPRSRVTFVMQTLFLKNYNIRFFQLIQTRYVLSWIHGFFAEFLTVAGLLHYV